MYNFRKSIIALTFILIAVFMCGCTTTVINNESDEIKLYSWKYIGEQGLVANLSFENDNAALTVESSGEHCKIEGLCVFGEQSFVIVDNTLKKKFIFNYTLSGKNLELQYNDSLITFDKEAL